MAEALDVALADGGDVMDLRAEPFSLGPNPRWVAKTKLRPGWFLAGTILALLV